MMESVLYPQKLSKRLNCKPLIPVIPTSSWRRVNTDTRIDIY